MFFNTKIRMLFMPENLNVIEILTKHVWLEVLSISS